MAKKVLILLGTKKGAFILESDESRRSWGLRGPFCETWPLNHVIADPASGAIYGGGGDLWFGPAIWQSTDLGATWTHSSEGLAYQAEEEPIKTVWSIAPTAGSLYAGVEPAGLFRSDDAGQSWRHVRGLRDHPTRPHWQPGGAGLILHSLVPHPSDERQLWVGISSAGVFYTADGGESFEPRNRGTRCDFLPEKQRYPEYGQCVHCLVMAPGMPDLLYQQNHCGMYRSDDGGRQWESIEAGLPSTFGFPAAVHPRDPATLYLLPLNGDIAGRYVPDARAAVWRTRDGGGSWDALRAGLPQENVFFGVLRQAMATDRLEPAGVYFGTNTGSVFASADEGDTWSCIAQHLPLISSVETLVVEA
jgi:photosystem II stability/assembly factor-like uncharacterized protein